MSPSIEMAEGSGRLNSQMTEGSGRLASKTKKKDSGGSFSHPYCSPFAAMSNTCRLEVGVG